MTQGQIQLIVEGNNPRGMVTALGVTEAMKNAGFCMLLLLTDVTVRD